MNVVVNGERRTVPDASTLTQLMEQMSMPQRGVAVAIDGEVRSRAGWDAPLTEGATIEVLTAVQGG